MSNMVFLGPVRSAGTMESFQVGKEQSGIGQWVLNYFHLKLVNSWNWIYQHFSPVGAGPFCYQTQFPSWAIHGFPESHHQQSLHRIRISTPKNVRYHRRIVRKPCFSHSEGISSCEPHHKIIRESISVDLRGQQRTARVGQAGNFPGLSKSGPKLVL